MNKSSSIRNERQLTAWEEARVLAVELATILSRPEITSLGLGEVAVTIEPTSGSTNTVFFSPRELLVGKELLKVVAKFEKRRQRAENTGRDNDLEFEQALDRCDKVLEKMATVPAHSLAGLRHKARALAFNEGTVDLERLDLPQRMVRSILRDLLNDNLKPV